MALGGRENDFFLLKIIFLSLENILSEVNKTYIGIINVQMFELLKYEFCKKSSQKDAPLTS